MQIIVFQGVARNGESILREVFLGCVRGEIGLKMPIGKDFIKKFCPECLFVMSSHCAAPCINYNLV